MSGPTRALPLTTPIAIAVISTNILFDTANAVRAIATAFNATLARILAAYARANTALSVALGFTLILTTADQDHNDCHEEQH